MAVGLGKVFGEETVERDLVDALGLQRRGERVEGGAGLCVGEGVVESGSHRVGDRHGASGGVKLGTDRGCAT